MPENLVVTGLNLCAQVHYLYRLASMAKGSLHPDVLSGNIHDGLGNPKCHHWAAWFGSNIYIFRWLCSKYFHLA